MNGVAAVPMVELVTGSATLHPDLLKDWEQLHRASSTSSPFQSAAWNAAHLRAYGTDDACALTLRRGGQLGAAGAFRSRRVGPATVLTAAPPKLSDFTDVILDGSHDTAELLAAGSARTDGWDVLDFPEVPPTADLWRLVRSWPGPVVRLPASQCVVMDGPRLDDYASALPRPKRKQLKQQQRGVGRAGVTAVRTDGNADAVRRLLAMHRDSWADDEITAEHATARFAQLLVDAVREMTARREAALVEFHQDGHVRGAALYLVGAQSVGIYLTGHSPGLRDEVNLHVMELDAGFELTSDLGRPHFSLLRGLEPYKLRFPARLETSERVMLVRPGSAAGRALTLGVLARRRAAGAVRSGRRRLAGWRTVRRSP